MINAFNALIIYPISIIWKLVSCARVLGASQLYTASVCV